jgi:hypothetical protein
MYKSANVTNLDNNKSISGTKIDKARTPEKISGSRPDRVSGIPSSD